MLLCISPSSSRGFHRRPSFSPLCQKVLNPTNLSLLQHQLSRQSDPSFLALVLWLGVENCSFPMCLAMLVAWLQFGNWCSVVCTENNILGVLWPVQREEVSHSHRLMPHLSFNAAYTFLAATSPWQLLLSRESTKTHKSFSHWLLPRLIYTTLYWFQLAFWTQVENLKLIPLKLHLVGLGSLIWEVDASFLFGFWFSSQQKPFSAKFDFIWL
jgi:hypothetical protein